MRASRCARIVFIWLAKYDEDLLLEENKCCSAKMTCTCRGRGGGGGGGGEKGCDVDCSFNNVTQVGKKKRRGK